MVVEFTPSGTLPSHYAAACKLCGWTKNDFKISKSAALVGAAMVGAGSVLLILQQYLIYKRERRLLKEICLLHKRVKHLERQVSRLHEALFCGSENEEDVFVDASDEGQQVRKSDATSKSIVTFYTADDGTKTECNLRALDDKLKDADRETIGNVYNKLKKIADEHPKDVEVLWRLARAQYLMGSEDYGISQNDEDPTVRANMEQARDILDNALKIDPKSAMCHKWAAIVIGSATQFLPISDQIKSAYIIRDHIVATLEQCPDDFMCNHMLGRWCLSVYMLTWVERKFAAALFGTPPTSTLEEAMQYLFKAEETCKKQSIDNALYIAKAYIAKSDYKKAAEWLEVAYNLPASSKDDKAAKVEVESLWKSYKSYR